MKKSLSLFLLILMAFSLNACNAHTEPEESEPVLEEVVDNQMQLQIGDYIFTATLADNTSAEALRKMLEAGPITIDMHDYGNMEKVGSLGSSLPRNDEQITATFGDLILYQRSAWKR